MEAPTHPLPPLMASIRQHGLEPKKAYGQHFLHDPTLLAQIVACAGDLAGQTLVEIGPGPGGLTRAMLSSDAAAVHVVEKDARCMPILSELQSYHPDRLHIHHTDALEVDFSQLGDTPRTLIANLPYNVSTPLLIHLLRHRQAFARFTLMFQKEVAERIISQPGQKSYGRLSVITQLLCETRRDFDIPPGAFYPPPKVVSTVISLTPRQTPLTTAPMDVLEKVTASAFGQRRKMLRQSLKTLGVPVEDLLEKAGIAPTARAEEIDIQGFARLAEAVSS